ncbi:hypothetical protein V495_04191 [Pseudogymnoascus sp. VKM F-4514 (FW-929)]|nr:hypothetical protein V495_04191 [Pseudogymnoascus sp. VKM F-4514 (FW-929)]KFY61789.1 hypothetical protein V497_02741 [Pseudogymnoascus sp. VKM F-4516 (FW-969)]
MSQLLLATAAGLVVNAATPPGNLLPLPPMGFNNWARYTTQINQSIFVDAADAMERTGLLKAGYNYINLDDAWSTKQRAANGSMVWDSEKFPDGMPWLTAHLKSKGFIPGIYTDAGNLSCGGYPGALDHEEIDLKTFTEWGFEYLKMDGCSLPDDTEETYHEVYSRWNNLLSEAEHPLIFSDSAPAYFVGRDNLTDWYSTMNWAQEYGQLARHCDDIANYGEGNAWKSMMGNYGQHVRLARYQKPGYINDPDFLNVDNPTYSLDEKKSQFALWCSFSAPLLLSTDLTAITDEEVEFLTNEDLLAVDQDSLIQQATLVSRDETWDVLSKSLDNGDRLLTILNKGGAAADLEVSWERLGLSAKAADGTTVKNLWTGEQEKASTNGITAQSVPSHGTAVFRVSNFDGSVTPTGIIFNTFSLNCLTDDESGKVTWTNCTASDAQTWKVRDDGHINSLSQPDKCLADANGNIQSTESGCNTDTWKYEVSGNLINAGSNNCLTEAEEGAATGERCGYETNEQVVGLPIGVTVN